MTLTQTHVRATFDRFDKNRSGTLEARELARLLEALGMEPDDDELARALEELDKDGSGSLSWDEFWKWWTERA
jgi:Ca2+-binding EF-hand superfamily protein